MDLASASLPRGPRPWCPGCLVGLRRSGTSALGLCQQETPQQILPAFGTIVVAAQDPGH